MTYQLSRDGQLFGPYTIEDLQRYLASGNVMPTDLARGEGMADWIPVSQLLQLGAPPPPPAYPAQAFAQPSAWAVPSVYGQTPGAPTVAMYPLFPVATTKFVVMSLFTLGLYHVYWAYKSWDRIQMNSKEAKMPWARAIFLNLWNFSFFERIRTRAANEEIPVRWNPIALGIGALVFTATAYLPHGFSIISPLSFVPYLPVLGTIQQINAKDAGMTEERPNDRFTGANIAWIIPGGIVLVLAVIGWTMQLLGIHPAR